MGVRNGIWGTACRFSLPCQAPPLPELSFCFSAEHLSNHLSACGSILFVPCDVVIRKIPARQCWDKDTRIFIIFVKILILCSFLSTILFPVLFQTKVGTLWLYKYCGTFFFLILNKWFCPQEYFFDSKVLTDGELAPNDRCCRVCGKIGHYMKDCPKRRRYKDFFKWFLND